MSAGQNEEKCWLGLFLLTDGSYAFVSAWCDYTGCDCQSGGYSMVGPDVSTTVRLAMGDADRAARASVWIGHPLLTNEGE